MARQGLPASEHTNKSQRIVLHHSSVKSNGEQIAWLSACCSLTPNLFSLGYTTTLLADCCFADSPSDDPFAEISSVAAGYIEQIQQCVSDDTRMFWIGARVRDGLAVHRVRISVFTEDCVSAPRIMQLISLSLRPIDSSLLGIKFKLLQAQHVTLATVMHTFEDQLKDIRSSFDQFSILQFALLLGEMLFQCTSLPQDEKSKLMQHCESVVSVP